MDINILKPRKALNKAYLKVKPNRTDIESFKSHLIQLLDKIETVDKSPKDESEEHLKNDIRDFLRDTYFRDNYAINTKDKKDLVIHLGKSTTSNVGVIIEAKRPSNKAEMVTKENLNKKALQELVLYYLRERITLKNLEVKHLVITNINEWFVFDATTFDRLFAQNKKLVKQFEDFENGRLADTKTDFFYKQIAEPFIADIKSTIEYTYFNLQDYQKPLRNNDKADDNKLIALFKLLSPEHLLKLPFSNDSNSLDKRFYSELLHIIGLTETKNGSKKLIERNKSGERHTGTLLEDAIIQLDSSNKLSYLDNPTQFGSTQEERLFNVALELSITWINRILFLKLLEAQLISYHKGDSSYSFLNIDTIKNYDDLNSLFFQVLARKHEERNEDVKKPFEKIPYLNSSLFEQAEIERQFFEIGLLRGDHKTIPLFSQTVLKDQNGKKRKGELSALEYLFEFLNAYDFSSEGSEDIQEDNKTLINASVLGLIFEKINGYKDGSFFTPGFITMYMCRETIRKAVVQKFNEAKGWNCKTLDDLYDKIDNRKEANDIVNSLKICDPAVGSGHFLVSALNEIIAIKNDLKILQDRDGKRLKEYTVEVVNDELIVTDDEGELFEYNPKSKESQRIQETLFHEKQGIIENCLFGVDINPNSVKICRLRLWIELLKNAYYIQDGHPELVSGSQLQTLPNIDINIKCGNSLVSRFAIDADLKAALKKSKWTIDAYRVAVDTYRNAKSKEEKREMERLINDIKSDFRSEISANDPKLNKHRKLQGELYMLNNQGSLFEMSKKEKTAWNKKVAKLTKDSQKLEKEIEEIKANKIFENAFEWRFEFPEVLNDEGDFVGFDCVIGNPPYGAEIEQREFYKTNYKEVSHGQIDTYKFFLQKGLELLRNDFWFSYITSDSYLEKEYFKDVRKYVTNQSSLIKNIKLGDNVFEEVNLPTAIILLRKGENKKQFRFADLSAKDRNKLHIYLDKIRFDFSEPQFESKFTISTSIIKEINTKPLIELYDQVMGVKVYQKGKGKPKQTSYEKENDIFIANKALSNDYMPFISQGIKRYFYENKKEFIKYGKWLAEPRDIRYFESKKVVLREIVNPRIYGCLIDYPCVVKNIAAVVIQKNDAFSLEYLLGLINSKLMTFYLYEQTPKSSNKSYPSFTSRLLKSIPIKIDKPDKRKLIAELANEVHQKKTQDITFNTIDLEKQLDQMVYELYGLTEEEIKIVEGIV